MTSVIGRLCGIVLPNAIASVLAADLLAGCAYIQSALPAPAGASARGSTGPERVLLFIEGCRWLESTAGLVTDSNGPLYGFAAMGELHASNCGSGGCGTVFNLTPAGPGHRPCSWARRARSTARRPAAGGRQVRTTARYSVSHRNKSAQTPVKRRAASRCLGRLAIERMFADPVKSAMCE